MDNPKKFRTTNVTKFEFFIKGQSDKNIDKVVSVLKELGIGSVDIKRGKLVKREEVVFDHGSGYHTANPRMSEFIGIKRDYAYSGEDVSEMKIKK
jgi:hypothetical protein